MSSAPPIPDQPTIPGAPIPGKPEDVPDIGTPEPRPDHPLEPGAPAEPRPPTG
jgi:hypothetical protein